MFPADIAQELNVLLPIYRLDGSGNWSVRDDGDYPSEVPCVSVGKPLTSYGRPFAIIAANGAT